MVNKVTFVGFRGEITPIIPPGLPPAQMRHREKNSTRVSCVEEIVCDFTLLEIFSACQEVY